MESFLSRYKNPLVLAIVLMAQVMLLAVQVRKPFPAATAAVDQAGVRAVRLGMTTVVTPPEGILHGVGLWVRGVWSGYFDLIGARRENAELREQVNRLQLEQAALAEDARQGQRLQDLLAFRQHYIQRTVPAQVIGSSGNDRARVVYIDKGSEDGLAVDMPVITPDGVVGRVREVYPRTSQVIEISDPASASGVLLEETRTRGIVRGINTGEPAITSVMPDDRIKAGQTVLTSGGDGVFPRGLPVGKVQRIVPDRENEPMVDVVLKPAANLNRLEEVLVITGTATAPTERARGDLARSEQVALAKFKAEQAAAEKAAKEEAQRASDILAARLPSREDAADPDAPDAGADAAPMTSEADARPLHPLNALHPDHYSPSAVPGATNLTPGERYTPLAQGNGTEGKAGGKTAQGADGAEKPATGDPAFAAAQAAVAAERKVLAEGKDAEAQKRYDALHPKVELPAAASASAAGSGVAPGSAAGAVHFVTRTNADGTTTRVAVPGAAGAGTGAGTGSATGSGAAGAAAAGSGGSVFHYVTRTGADGTPTRVALLGPAADGSGFHWVTRTNADGTTSRVAAPVPAGTRPAAGTNATAGAGASSANASGGAVFHYVTRTNADGTTTRVALAGPAADGSALHLVTRTNADGTTSRIAVPVTGGAPATGGSAASRTPAPAAAPAPGAPSAVLHWATRTNPDGTTARVALAGPAADGTGFRYVTRTGADGTVARVAVPIAPGSAAGARPAAPGAAAGGAAATAGTHSTTRVNADGTTTRVAAPNPAGRPAATPGQPVRTVIVTDGPADRPRTETRTAPRTTGPQVVPDDGSRPPAPASPQGGGR